MWWADILYDGETLIHFTPEYFYSVTLGRFCFYRYNIFLNILVEKTIDYGFLILKALNFGPNLNKLAFGDPFFFLSKQNSLAFIQKKSTSMQGHRTVPSRKKIPSKSITNNK